MKSRHEILKEAIRDRIAQRFRDTQKEFKDILYDRFKVPLKVRRFSEIYSELLVNHELPRDSTTVEGNYVQKITQKWLEGINRMDIENLLEKYVEGE